MATTGEAAMMRAPPAPLQFTAVSQDIVTAWTATATGLPVNHIADHWKTRKARPAIWLCVPLFLLTSACDSEIVEAAERAGVDGAVLTTEATVPLDTENARVGK